MGGPKSFKDLFKTKPKVPFQPQPLASAPVPKITQQEYDRRKRCKEELTRFVNAQKCTVCGAQLDGPVNYEYAELYCVENNQHYKCKYLYGQPSINWSECVYQYDPTGYQVINWFSGGQYNVSIFALDMHLNEKFRFKEKKKVLSFAGSQLKFPKGLTAEEFQEKLKLYTTFI